MRIGLEQLLLQNHAAAAISLAISDGMGIARVRRWPMRTTSVGVIRGKVDACPVFFEP